ncbi:MAG: hypothetical protein H6707_00705 [Deltaproteobacteria bacterium]|nr:hypothetical protein [Deltaproteobacteria bacterium]
MHENDSTAVILFTAQFIIEGRVFLPPSARLTDFLRESAPFIAVTDAVISDHKRQELFRAEFINVAREKVELALPQAALQSSPK